MVDSLEHMNKVGGSGSCWRAGNCERGQPRNSRDHLPINCEAVIPHWVVEDHSLGFGASGHLYFIHDYSVPLACH